MRLFAIALSCAVSGFAQSSIAATRGRIWVEMKGFNEQIDEAAVVDALALRLPDWGVASMPKDETVKQLCEQADGKHYFIVIASTESEGRVEMFTCGDERPLWTQTVPLDGEKDDAQRRIAVLVGLTVSSELSTEPLSETPDDHTENASAGAKTERRITGTVALVPGVSVSPAGRKAVFYGVLDGGLLFSNGIMVELGVGVSSPYRGQADKNKNDEGSDISISVQSIVIRASIEYRLAIIARVWGAFGAAISYSHFVKRDLLDDKFAIEEAQPSARGAVSPLLTVGYSPLRFLSIVLTLSIDASFGKRTFKVRGEEPVALGSVSISGGLGLRFWI